MKSKFLFISLLFVFVAGISGCIGKRYEKTEKIEYKINSTGKTKLVVENLKGKILVTKGDSASGVQITAEITDKVKKKDLNKPLTDAVKLKIDTSSEAVRISSEGKSSGFNIVLGKASQKINYTITVPENFNLDIDNVTGDVEFINLSGNSNISVINGNIRGDHISGENKLEVVNGHITVTLDSTKGLEMDAVNGSIELNITDSFKGLIRASAVNGKIKTDQKLNFENVNSEKNSFKGVIGNSSAEVKIDVVNGKVSILKKQ